jgi:hypothetical protein
MLWLKHKTNLGPGLERAFSEGELIPLKGIFFRVEKVENSQLILVPKTMTAARRKEIENAG